MDVLISMIKETYMLDTNAPNRNIYYHHANLILSS